jgi:hypothetical protein
MHSGIVVVELKDKNSQFQQWKSFTDAIESKIASAGKAIERLAENVWLVNFQKSPSVLAWIVVTAERNDLTYKILQFDGEPQWLPVA